MDGFVVMHLYNPVAGREDDLARYFREVHVPKVLGQRGIEGVQRFRVIEKQLMAECAQPWQYATMYEFRLDAPELHLPALGSLLADIRDAGLIAPDGAERIHTYRMYHDWKYSSNLQPGRPHSHIMFLLANITPGCDADYHRWYDEVHSVEVSESPGYISMRRGKLCETQVPPVHYCPGSELILGGLQSDDIEFSIQDFIDRAYGRSPSGVVWSPRPKTASIARTVHLAELIDGPYPASHRPG